MTDNSTLDLVTQQQSVEILELTSTDASPELTVWLTDQSNRLRVLIKRTTVDLVEFGRILTDVRTTLPHKDFLAFVEAVGISRPTAYRWIAAAGAAQGCSHVENIEST